MLLLRAQDVPHAKIAEQLGISERSAHRSQHDALDKLGVESLPEAVALLRQHGVIPASLPHDLKGQELEVMTLRGEGLTIEEVAARLQVKTNAVKARQASALAKVGAPDLQEGLNLLRNEGLIPPARPGQGLKRVRGDGRGPPARSDVITSEELQVMTMRGEGLEQREIARRLNVSLPTVKSLQARALAKVGASNLVEGLNLLRNEDTIPPAQPGQGLRRVRGDGEGPPARSAELTKQELDVMTWRGSGMTLDRIAEQLHVSPSTAGVYQSRALAKLGAGTPEEGLERLRSEGAILKPLSEVIVGDELQVMTLRGEGLQFDEIAG